MAAPVTAPLLAALLVAAPAGGAVKVAVMPVGAGEGVSDKTAAAVTEAVAAEVRRVPEVQAITQREIASLLSLEQQKALLGCQSDTCMAEIGGALGVDRLVVGDLAVLGESWLFHLKLLDVKRSRVVGQSDRRLRGGSIDDLLDALPSMVAEIFPGSSSAPARPGPGRTVRAGPPAAVEEPLSLPPEVLAKLFLWRDAAGHIIAAVPFGGIDEPMLAGDASALQLQRVFGGRSDALGFELVFWEPRARVPADASFDVREGKGRLFCKDRIIAFEPVPEAESRAILKEAKLLRPRWRRYAHALARDDDGNYFYVDGARNAFGDPADDPAYRLYSGVKGRLQARELVDAFRDSAGEIFVTPTGKLRLAKSTDGKPTVEWLHGQGRSHLTWLDPQANGALIYGGLGVYQSERLGTPCDDVFGRP
jgi:hypothetical protein